ncbi:uncharacterized protein TrAtP1_002772 [Trichoderma atroviride]|uniref:uncharacterized protein n=1 Tax=Hypocrea atroviridis TaxID=63577 RepID=UPI003329514E|nr:hypothetical protein TrAtP1_002772 [Trichoderma atroviride]
MEVGEKLIAQAHNGSAEMMSRGFVGDGGRLSRIGFRYGGEQQKAGVTFHWSSRHDRRVASEVQPGALIRYPGAARFGLAESAAVG